MEENANKVKLAVMQEQAKGMELIHKKEKEIAELKTRIETDNSQALVREGNLKERYERELQQKQDMVNYYKDLKTRMSTKMVGETLEAHCNTLYNTTLRSVLPNAYFEKAWRYTLVAWIRIGKYVYRIAKKLRERMWKDDFCIRSR